jgi:hypothetical protein
MKGKNMEIIDWTNVTNLELEILARNGTTAEVRTAAKAEQERRERPEAATLSGSDYDAPERG